MNKPKIIEKYLFGTEVLTDWQVGSPIVWKGEWQGQLYEDKGKILELVENRIFFYSHFSLNSDESDFPENYHTVSVELENIGAQTKVTLIQDINEPEFDREHSGKN